MKRTVAAAALAAALLVPDAASARLKPSDFYDGLRIPASVIFTGSPVYRGASPFVLEGATNDEFETTIGAPDVTVDQTGTIPDVSLAAGAADADWSFVISLANAGLNDPHDLNSQWFSAAGLNFEGATANGIEMTLAVADPDTADRSITLPNEDGTVFLSTLLTNGPDEANAVWGASNALTFEGVTADGFEVSFSPADPTVGDTTITIPNTASVADTLALLTLAQTFVGLKTFGAITVNGIATIGDGGDAVTVNSDNWDIGATGDLTGVENYTTTTNVASMVFNLDVSGVDVAAHNVELRLDGNSLFLGSGTGGGGGAIAAIAIDIGLTALAETFRYGDATSVSHAFLSDGVGTAEFTLVAGAIDGTEILDGTVVLTTDTDGAYVATVAAAAAPSGVAVTSAGGEGAAGTFDFDYTATTAANPTLAIGECVFGTTGLICEAGAADTFESLLRVATLTADQAYDLPDWSGTIPVPTSAGTTTTVLHGSAAGQPTYGAVVAADITDITRTVPLPLDAWDYCGTADRAGGAGLNFADTADAFPDLTRGSAGTTAGSLALEWDTGDTEKVCVSVPIPTDYVSGSTVRLYFLDTATNDHTHDADTLLQATGSAEDTTLAPGAGTITPTNGPSGQSAVTACDSSGTASAIYACDFATEAVAAGNIIVFSYARAAGTEATTMFGAEFRYTATE